MKRYLLSIPALLLVGGLQAQITAAGEAKTDVGVAVKVDAQSKSDSDPKGTKFTRGMSSSARIGWWTASASSHASAGSNYDWRTRKLSYGGSLSDHGSLYSTNAASKSSANSTGDGGKAGSHSVDITIKATSSSKGKLVLSIGGHAMTGASASGSITVGTKTLSWKSGDQPKTDSMDVTVDSTGLVATLTTNGAAALDGKGRTAYSVHASVWFVPDAQGGTKCTITKDQDGCGPTLVGKVANTSFFGHTLQFDLSNAPKSTFGINVFADKGDVAKFQTCPILFNIVGFGTFKTSDTGTARHFMRIPSNKDLTFWTQDMVFTFSSKGLDLTSSNTLKIECKTQ